MILISLEDAKAEVRKVVHDFKTRYDINYRLNNLPSLELEDEAEQTEQKGEWRYNDKVGTFKVYTCSECGLNVESDKWGYCPNCGADMRGVAEQTEQKGEE